MNRSMYFTKISVAFISTIFFFTLNSRHEHITSDQRADISSPSKKPSSRKEVKINMGVEDDEVHRVRESILNIKPFSFKASPSQEMNSTNGDGFLINKISWNWRALSDYPNLTDLLVEKKTQKIFSIDDATLRDVPRLVSFQDVQTHKRVNSSQYINSSQAITMAVCLPCK